MAITDQHIESYTDLMVALVLERPLDDVDEERLRPNDRRRHLRYYVNQNCLYLVSGQLGLEHGTLYDISRSGLYIGGYHKTDIGQSVTVLIDPKQQAELPFIINAVVMRDVGMTPDGIYRYGCKITSIVNPNNQLDTDDITLKQVA